MDNINEIVITMFKKLIIAETKLGDREGTNKLLKNLAENISRIKTPIELKQT